MYSVFNPPTGCLASHIDAELFEKLRPKLNVSHFRDLPNTARWAREAIKLIPIRKRSESYFNHKTGEADWWLLKGSLSTDDLLRASCRMDKFAVGTIDHAPQNYYIEDDDEWIEAPAVGHIRLDVDMPSEWRREASHAVKEACVRCAEVIRSSGGRPTFILTGSKGFAVYAPLGCFVKPEQALPLADAWKEAMITAGVNVDKHNLRSNMRLPLGMHASNYALGVPFDPATLEVLPSEQWVDVCLSAVGAQNSLEDALTLSLPPSDNWCPTFESDDNSAEVSFHEGNLGWKSTRSGGVRPDVLARANDIVSSGILPGMINNSLMPFLFGWRIVHGEDEESLNRLIAYVCSLPGGHGDREKQIRDAWRNWKWFERGQRREPLPISMCSPSDPELKEWVSAFPAGMRKDRRRNMESVARTILSLIRAKKPVSVRAVERALDQAGKALSQRVIHAIMRELPSFGEWIHDTRWDATIPEHQFIYFNPLIYRPAPL